MPLPYMDGYLSKAWKRITKGSLNSFRYNSCLIIKILRLFKLKTVWKVEAVNFKMKQIYSDKWKSRPYFSTVCSQEHFLVLELL